LRERLQKILSRAGVCSRRQAEELIRQKRVTVAGQIAGLGQKADPASEEIRLDGRIIDFNQPAAVYLFNKPPGIITTLDDPQGRPCLDQLVARLDQKVYPVGRLDVDTSGLLVLTNDGNLAQRLAHPRYGVDKTYQVRVRGRADETALKRLRKGVFIGDRVSAPSRVRLLKRWPKGALLNLTIHEGRHHQVKRMCAQVGLRVEELTRIRVGPLHLGGIKTGEIKKLSKIEVGKLKKELGLDGPDSV
jgi:23S rRNA pseudouridine2605 synthase